MYGGAKLPVEAQIFSLHPQLARLQADRANILEKLGGVVPSPFRAKSLPKSLSSRQTPGKRLKDALPWSWPAPVRCGVKWQCLRLACGPILIPATISQAQKATSADMQRNCFAFGFHELGLCQSISEFDYPTRTHQHTQRIFRILAEHSAQLRGWDLFARNGIYTPTGWPGHLPSLTNISFSTTYDEICIPYTLVAPCPTATRGVIQEI
ncbi:hypothetical protein FB45DRAFT_1066391 [Roridomyces roridus]|uniref:Uncharacterized protein n=1 Tax=Roridomyces roridus TaxID=1738132 RepID=A0AAD7B549_9AGAR|nr:hypothetical protein FB45DRAFT_1066391 [Roridomyces roridus]